MSEALMTPAPWFAVEYAGFFKIQDEPYYSSNDILDAEYVGEPTAKLNATAIISAINGTYGIGVDPSKIDEVIKWADHLHESIQHLFDMKAKKGSTSVMKNAWNIVATSLYQSKAAIEKAKLHTI